MGKRYSAGQVQRQKPILNNISSSVPGNTPRVAPKTADDFGAQNARNITALGDALGDASGAVASIDKIISKPDQITASNEFLNANKDILTYVANARNAEGEESMKVFDNALSQFQTIKEKSLQNLSSYSKETRDFFEKNFNNKVAAHMESLAFLQAENVKKQEQVTLDLLNKNSMENALLYKDNPDAIMLAEQEIIANTSKQTKRLDQVQREERIQTNISKLHLGIIEAYSAESSVAALNYLKNIEKDPNRIDPTIVPALKSKLEKAAILETATSTANSLSKSGLPLEEQMSIIEKQFNKDKNEELYRETKKQVKYNFELQKAGEARAEEEKFDQIVFELLDDPYKQVSPASDFSAKHNLAIKRIQDNNLAELQNKRVDDMALYAKVKSGELKIDSISSFVDKHGGSFKNSTLKELINWHTGLKNKDDSAFQLMTAYQQATQNIKGISDFDKNEEGNTLRGQFFTEFQRRLSTLSPEDRKNQEKRQQIINDLLAPAESPGPSLPFRVGFVPADTPVWNKTIYRFQLPYLEDKDTVKALSNEDTVPEPLKAYDNLQVDKVSKLYYRDVGNIRHVYDPITGKEIRRGIRK